MSLSDAADVLKQCVEFSLYCLSQSVLLRLDGMQVVKTAI